MTPHSEHAAVVLTVSTLEGFHTMPPYSSSVEITLNSLPILVPRVWATPTILAASVVPCVRCVWMEYPIPVTVPGGSTASQTFASMVK